MNYRKLSLFIILIVLLPINGISSGYIFDPGKIKNLEIDFGSDINCDNYSNYSGEKNEQQHDYYVCACLYTRNKREDGIECLKSICSENFEIACKTLDEIFLYEDLLFDAAVKLYADGEIGKARKVLEYLKKSGRHLDDFIRILEGLIYVMEEDYVNAKSTVYPISNRVENAYNKVKGDKKFTKEDHLKVEFLYDNLNMILGVSNFHLHNFAEARAYLDRCQDLEKNLHLYTMKGVAEAKLGNIEEAINIYTKLYERFEDNTYKQEAAYNIASIYAKSQKPEMVIFWLDRVFVYGRSEYWKNFLKSDEDFSSLIKDDFFLDYLDRVKSTK